MRSSAKPFDTRGERVVQAQADVPFGARLLRVPNELLNEQRMPPRLCDDRFHCLGLRGRHLGSELEDQIGCDVLRKLSEFEPANVRDQGGDALVAIDHSIGNNRRDDGLYEAYNLVVRSGDGVTIENLYLMLEGQVGALSSGAIGAAEAADILDTMFTSTLYRAKPPPR